MNTGAKTGSSRQQSRRIVWWTVLAAVVITFAGVMPAAASAPNAGGHGQFDAKPSHPSVNANRWTPRPSLTLARAGLGVEKVSGQILAIGGFTPDETFSSVETRRVLGPGVWRNLEALELKIGRANHITAEVSGMVYAAGGFSDFDIESSVERFDPRRGQWTTLRTMLPEVRAAAGGAGLGGLFYIAGGFVPAGEELDVTNSVIVYDPTRNAWRNVKPMTYARARLELVAAGGQLYAIGGADTVGQSLNVVERYDPRSDRWTTINALNDSRVIPCGVQTTVGRRQVIVVVGGAEFDASGSLVAARRTTEVLDLTTGRWTTLPALFETGRSSLGCTTESDGTVLAIGGVIRHEDGQFEYLDDVDALKVTADDLR